jgi:hypothetical protein
LDAISFYLLNLCDLNAGEVLTVPLALLVSGLVLVLLDDDLWTASLVKHFCHNLDLGKTSKTAGSSMDPDLAAMRFMVTMVPTSTFSWRPPARTIA